MNLLNRAMRAVEAREQEDQMSERIVPRPPREVPEPPREAVMDPPRREPVYDMPKIPPFLKREAAAAMPIAAPRAAGLRVYLAGPMSGIPEFNYPMFRAAAVMLRARGYAVFSPAEYDDQKHGKSIVNAAGSVAQATADHGFNLREALAAELAWICAEAEAIAMLPGWENSKGARTEHALAVALDLKRLYLE